MFSCFKETTRLLPQSVQAILLLQMSGLATSFSLDIVSLYHFR